MVADAHTTLAPAEVAVSPLPPSRFRALLGDAYAEVEEAIATALGMLGGRVIWHLNSTATGGGVAELLQSLLGYARGAGVDVRWQVINGSPDFFRLTKLLHNKLHGASGIGLTDEDADLFRRVSQANAEGLAPLVRGGDIVYLHDPQTAGLVGPMLEAGATVLWRCHIGVDEPNADVREAWEFLRPQIEGAHAYVFSRDAYVWEGLDRDRVTVVPPSIDAFSAKNEPLEPEVVEAILDRAGISSDGTTPATFRRHDGSAGRVDRAAWVEQDELIPAGAPLLTQVSRWDRLKDPVGVLEGFAVHCRAPGARLLLAGPAVEGVGDDPEGAEVLAEVREARARLAPERRRAVHLATLPMADTEENAAIVNAIQRRSTVVAQKSLAEGFGLTATEAMWKARPVVAGAVGGLLDQVEDGVTGRLVDPYDLKAFGTAADELLSDPALAARMGAAGRERVRERYLGARHLIQYVGLLGRLLS